MRQKNQNMNQRWIGSNIKLLLFFCSLQTNICFFALDKKVRGGGYNLSKIKKGDYHMNNSKKLSVVAIVGGAIGIVTFIYAMVLGASTYSLLVLTEGEGFFSPFKSIQLLLSTEETYPVAYLEIFSVFNCVLLFAESVLALIGGIIGNKGLLKAAKIFGIVLIPLFFLINFMESLLWIGILNGNANLQKQIATLPQFLPYFNLTVSILTIVASKRFNKSATVNAELTNGQIKGNN